jgi:hypothetical protein
VAVGVVAPVRRPRLAHRPALVREQDRALARLGHAVALGVDQPGPGEVAVRAQHRGHVGPHRQHGGHLLERDPVGAQQAHPAHRLARQARALVVHRRGGAVVHAARELGHQAVDRGQVRRPSCLPPLEKVGHGGEAITPSQRSPSGTSSRGSIAATSASTTSCPAAREVATMSGSYSTPTDSRPSSRKPSAQPPAPVVLQRCDGVGVHAAEGPRALVAGLARMCDQCGEQRFARLGLVVAQRQPGVVLGLHLGDDHGFSSVVVICSWWYSITLARHPAGPPQ